MTRKRAVPPVQGPANPRPVGSVAKRRRAEPGDFKKNCQFDGDKTQVTSAKWALEGGRGVDLTGIFVLQSKADLKGRDGDSDMIRQVHQLQPTTILLSATDTDIGTYFGATPPPSSHCARHDRQAHAYTAIKLRSVCFGTGARPHRGPRVNLSFGEGQLASRVVRATWLQHTEEKGGCRYATAISKSKTASRCKFIKTDCVPQASLGIGASAPAPGLTVAQGVSVIASRSRWRQVQDRGKRKFVKTFKTDRAFVAGARPHRGPRVNLPSGEGQLASWPVRASGCSTAGEPQDRDTADADFGSDRQQDGRHWQERFKLKVAAGTRPRGTDATQALSATVPLPRKEPALARASASRCLYAHDVLVVRSV
ncbi:hypothetical protein BD626DRAFT_534885 [Schizophyllum amplum]|uniref:Uncharacterized protein n=1 Tax=Schizophyllum amplum TaxID=97359 RepID=A0A550CPT5_9AGAR|nr:hypothetical protein BD626DRAFT_534885 [Auriculariopsis ampla]